jgi:hypothetical protein
MGEKAWGVYARAWQLAAVGIVAGLLTGLLPRSLALELPLRSRLVAASAGLGGWLLLEWLDRKLGLAQRLKPGWKLGSAVAVAVLSSAFFLRRPRLHWGDAARARRGARCRSASLEPALADRLPIRGLSPEPAGAYLWVRIGLQAPAVGRIGAAFVACAAAWGAMA